jgi:RND family efflux transporter MFP subunit
VELPYFTQGVRVTNNQKMVRMMDYSKMYLEASLPEKYFSRVKQDMDVYISNYTMPEDTLKGKVTQISPAIDPANRTFTCFIVIDNNKEKLLPGMFVNADVVAERSTNALILPKEIVSGRGTDRYVFVVDNNYAFRRRITTGLETLKNIEVVKGLNQGDRVVIKGAETLRERTKVKVLE